MHKINYNTESIMQKLCFGSGIKVYSVNWSHSSFKYNMAHSSSSNKEHFHEKPARCQQDAEDCEVKHQNKATFSKGHDHKSITKEIQPFSSKGTQVRDLAQTLVYSMYTLV